MGIALWTACALVLFAAARFVPSGRPKRWIGELAAALTSAMLFGLLATFLDFGGWNEADWRAGVFVFFGAATIVGVVRTTGVGFRESGVVATGIASRGSGVGAGNRFAPTAAETQPARSHATSSPTPDSRQATPAK